MKLLEKSQLNTLKANEQKMVIDSGVALAKKIDILRQELLDLEKRRTDFINSSRSELGNALVDLRKTKSNLDSEITEQRKLLAKLREPLDEEWHKLSLGQMELADLNKKANIYFAEIINERKQLQENTKKVDGFLEIAYKQKNESDKLLEKAENDRSKTRKALEQAQAIEDKYSVKYYNEGLRLSEWENKLKEREKTLKKDREAFNKEKKALEIKKTRWTT